MSKWVSRATPQQKMNGAAFVWNLTGRAAFVVEAQSIEARS
jgi:hypothetical protein